MEDQRLELRSGRSKRGRAFRLASDTTRVMLPPLIGA
jgi:hypothetical protein